MAEWAGVARPSVRQHSIGFDGGATDVAAAVGADSCDCVECAECVELLDPVELLGRGMPL